MSQRETLEVQMDDRLVGTLALTANHKVAFSYSLPDAWEQKRCGKMEYDYSLCAKACGMVMTEIRLFHQIYVRDILEQRDLIEE